MKISTKTFWQNKDFRNTVCCLRDMPDDSSDSSTMSSTETSSNGESLRPITSYRHKLVRDLHWVCSSHHLLSEGSKRATNVPTWGASQLDFVVRRSQDWFAMLDDDPEELREYIQSQKTSHRLGHYFTCLLQYLLEHNPVVNAKNVWCRQGVLSDENHGELTSLKFLVVRNKTSYDDDNIPERFHLEASIHFSVTMSPKETDVLATRFSGPFLYESLAWRIVETRRKLSIAEHPIVKQWLDEKCGGDVEHMWLLRGCVFYSWKVFRNLSQFKTPKYELLGQDHPKGWWVQQDSEEVLGDILNYYGDNTRFAMITHKRYWMSPSVGSDDGTELVGDETIGIEPVPLVGLEGIIKSIHAFTEASSKRPVMVAVCMPDDDTDGRYVEVSRGFILPTKWVVERDVSSSESEDCCHVETRSCAAFQESLYEILRKSGRVDSIFEAVKGIDLQDVRMCDQPKAPPKLKKPEDPLMNLNDRKDIQQWICSISAWRTACIARHPPKKSGRGLGRAQSQRLRTAIMFELNELMCEEGSQAVSDIVLKLCLEVNDLGQEEVHAILEAVEGLRKHGWRCTTGRSLLVTINKCLDDDSVSPMVIQKVCRCFDVEPSKVSIEKAVERYVAARGEDTAYIAGLRLLCQQCNSDAHMKAAQERPDQAQLWNPVKGANSRIASHHSPTHFEPIVRGQMPLVMLSSEVPVKWVSSEMELDDCVRDISQYRTIGIDVEWSSGPGAALFQVASEDTVYLIDMLVPEIRQSSTLFSTLRRVRRVLGFSISADLERIPQLKECGVIDVQVDKRGSLQRHVAGQLGAYLDKTEQCSEWADRPLSESQKNYAALDAYTLLALDAHIRGVPDDGALGPSLFD